MSTIHVRNRSYSRAHYKLMGAVDARGTTVCGAAPTAYDYSFGDARHWNCKDEEYAKNEGREMCEACMKGVAKS